MNPVLGDEQARLDWAMRYVSYGWALVPVNPRGKEPHKALLGRIYGDTRTGHLKKAPALLEEVVYWFEQEPDLNLGVFPVGSPDLVIADIDDLSVAPDLKTPTARSGREEGGQHMYFTHPVEVPRTNPPWGHVNPEYAVLPESVHETGAVYQWLPGLRAYSARQGPGGL